MLVLDEDVAEILTRLDNEPAKDPPTIFSREGAIPSHETFMIKPIRKFVERWITVFGESPVIVDPFARNSTYGTITNDMNPNTAAQYHMDAREFIAKLLNDGVVADAVILDPPYSPRQIAECYQGFGATATIKDTQIASLFRECKNALTELVKPNGYALSFGWSSAGFSKRRGFALREVLMVYHGAGRNDTICTAEQKVG